MKLLDLLFIFSDVITNIFNDDKRHSKIRLQITQITLQKKIHLILLSVLQRRSYVWDSTSPDIEYA